MNKRWFGLLVFCIAFTGVGINYTFANLSEAARAVPAQASPSTVALTSLALDGLRPDQCTPDGITSVAWKPIVETDDWASYRLVGLPDAALGSVLLRHTETGWQIVDVTCSMQ